MNAAVSHYRHTIFGDSNVDSTGIISVLAARDETDGDGGQ